MHPSYHIPVPHLTPTEDEMSWAQEHIIPVAEANARALFERLGPKFDKTNVDQSVFNGWRTGERMRAHFDELGLHFKRFSVFVGAPGAKAAQPHIDAGGIGFPMIARLNVPLQGIKGSCISWWDKSVNDSRIKERHFEEWHGGLNKMLKGFSYLSDPSAVWEDPAYKIVDPGPCWNHVELVHRLDLDNTTEIRVNITAELLKQIPWTELVSRLQAKGYCHS